MISTTTKRSSRVYFNPYESIEVDFGKFAEISGEPILKGFVLNVQEIWE